MGGNSFNHPIRRRGTEKMREEKRRKKTQLERKVLQMHTQNTRTEPLNANARLTISMCYMKRERCSVNSALTVLENGRELAWEGMWSVDRFVEEQKWRSARKKGRKKKRKIRKVFHHFHLVLCNSSSSINTRNGREANNGKQKRPALEIDGDYINDACGKVRAGRKMVMVAVASTRLARPDCKKGRKSCGNGNELYGSCEWFVFSWLFRIVLLRMAFLLVVASCFVCVCVCERERTSERLLYFWYIAAVAGNT